MPFQVRGERNKEKPLIRKKSDLPADTGTVRALMEHIRPDDYLKTPPDINKCQIWKIGNLICELKNYRETMKKDSSERFI